MSHSIPGKPVFPALPRHSSRGSTHTTVARGTALWESLVGNPRGKASRESHRSLDPREGKGETAATAREERSFPCWVGKEFPAFPSHLKRRRSPQERREELQDRGTFPESPRCLSPFQGNQFSLHCFDFQAEDRLTTRWHVEQSFGKVSWEILVGKPRRKATDPLIHAKESVTLLLQLGRKAHLDAPTRDED